MNRSRSIKKTKRSLNKTISSQKTRRHRFNKKRCDSKKVIPFDIIFDVTELEVEDRKIKYGY